MRVIKVLTLLFCGFLALPAKGQLVFIDSVVNLGDARAGDQRKVEYRIENRFKVPVLVKLMTSCVCQELDTAEFTLEPGKFNRIHFWLNTSSLSGFESSSLKLSMHDTSNHISGEGFIYYTVNMVKWQPKTMSGNGLCLRFMQTEKNSGDIYFGKSQTYIFDFQNCSSDTIYISDVGIPSTWSSRYNPIGIPPLRKGSFSVSTSENMVPGEFTYSVPIEFRTRKAVYRPDVVIRGNVVR